MEYRALGDSDLRVSEICLGTWTKAVADDTRAAVRSDQVRDNAAASGVELDQATLQAIEAVFA